MPAAIAVHGLTKRFGDVTAIDGVAFEVEAGSVFGFLGPNGSGKSTTLGILTGLVHADAGTCALRGRWGALVEEPAFYPDLSGRRNLLLFARLLQVPDARVDEVLAQAGLADAADRRYKGYSQGMRRRLGLAFALLGQPDILLLDEPANGLDPAGQKELAALLSAFAKAGGTVLLSSHSLAQVQEACTHAAILSKGRVVAQGRMQDLLLGGQEVQVDVDDVAKARKALGALGKQARVDGHRLTFPGDAADAADANARLVAHGVRVTRLDVRKGLEERFFEVTA